MSPIRAVILFCILALAFGQAREERKEREQPSQREQPQRAQQAGGFQCTPIDARGNSSIDLLQLAGDRSTTYFEVASSEATKQWLSKGCTCGRSEFKYVRFGDHEKLFANCFCDIEGQENPARQSGVLVPVNDVSAQGLVNPIRQGEENTGQFAYIVMDVDDARLPQEIQDAWKELREDRLEAWFETLPEDVKQAIIDHPQFKRYHPDITLEDISDKEDAHKQQRQEKISQHGQQEQETEQRRLSPIRRLMQARAEQQRREEEMRARRAGGETRRATARGGATQITEGPLLELNPEKEGGIDLMEVQILEFDPSKKCMIVTAGCREFVSILAADPESVTEDDINQAISRLEALGLSANELNISRTEVDDTCVQKVRQEEQEMESEATARTEEDTQQEQPQQRRETASRAERKEREVVTSPRTAEARKPARARRS